MFTWKWEILINLILWTAYWNPDRATHLTFTTSHRHRFIEIRVNGKMTRRRWPDVAMTMTRWCDESAKVLWRWSNALSHLSYSIIEPSLSRLSIIASNTFLHMCCLKKKATALLHGETVNYLADRDVLHRIGQFYIQTGNIMIKWDVLTFYV